jgi:hypothetical protein
VPFLPQCFEDDEEEKTDATATPTRVRVNARAADIDTTMVALRHTLDAGRRGSEAGRGSRRVYGRLRRVAAGVSSGGALVTIFSGAHTHDFLAQI